MKILRSEYSFQPINLRIFDSKYVMWTKLAAILNRGFIRQKRKTSNNLKIVPIISVLVMIR